MGWEHRREHYRIMYPTAARPRFIIGELAHEIVDLSDQGIRYRVGQQENRTVGDEIQGVVRFRRGETVPVLGSVVRVRGGDVALRLEPGIPTRIMLEEQRYLRERHRGSAW